MLDHSPGRHDEGVSDTRSLSARYYTDPAVLEAEKETLFYRSWRYLCHASQLDAPGRYVTTSIFDQDLFAVRGDDGEIRAFYNVCAHRGHRLLKGSGTKHRIACPYHAWTYDLDGRLLRAREARDSNALSNADICLSAIRVDRLLDFVFINLDPDARPLAESAPGLDAQILEAVPDIADYRPKDGVTYFGGDYACNWKVLIDNFLECNHCQVAHPSFSDLMDINSTSYSFNGSYSCQTIRTAGKADNKAFPLDLDEDAVTGHFWFLFPNTSLSVFPGVKNFAVSCFEPTGPQSARRHFDMMTPPAVAADREEARAKWGLEVVNEEDKALCENVQRGMRQRGYRQGYYLIDPDNGNLTEEGVRFFHRLYAERMGGVVV